MTTTTPTKPLDIQFDVCYDDFSDEWEAVADLISQAGIPSQVFPSITMAKLLTGGL